MRVIPLDMSNLLPPVENDVPIDYSKLDPLCVDIVKFFNRQGLATKMCCQGHNDTTQSLFYVQFEDDIVTDDILDFQKRFLDSRGSFCACGHFGKRVFLCSDYKQGNEREGQVIEIWEYVAGGFAAAEADLKRWTQMEAAGVERYTPEYFVDTPRRGVRKMSLGG